MSMDATMEGILTGFISGMRSRDLDLISLIQGLQLVSPLCVNGFYAEWDSNCKGLESQKVDEDEDVSNVEVGSDVLCVDDD